MKKICTCEACLYSDSLYSIEIAKRDYHPYRTFFSEVFLQPTFVFLKWTMIVVAAGFVSLAMIRTCNGPDAVVEGWCDYVEPSRLN